MSQEQDCVGQRPLEALVSMDAGEPVARALDQPLDWVLVTLDGQPSGLLHRRELMRLAGDQSLDAALAHSSGLVATGAATAVAELLQSPAVRGVRPSGVLVLDSGAPQGVWCEDALLEAGFLASDRLFSDASLAGQVDIARIVRRCRYRAGGQACTAVRTFDEKPAHLPACTDPAGLGAHAFGW